MKLSAHAYLVAGTLEAVTDIRRFLEAQGIETEGNPDVSVRTYNQFLIADARDLSDRANTKALGERRVFVVAFSSITGQAQNALLKTLEEPAAGTLFFLITPSPHTLLPTVRSRMQMLSLGKSGQGDPRAEAFIAAAPGDRIEMLGELLQKDDDDKRDLGGIITFLSSLERMLESDPARSRRGLEAVYRARKYAGDNGSMLKPLLEQVALLIQ